MFTQFSIYSVYSMRYKIIFYTNLLLYKCTLFMPRYLFNCSFTASFLFTLLFMLCLLTIRCLYRVAWWNIRTCFVPRTHNCHNFARRLFAAVTCHWHLACCVFGISIAFFQRYSAVFGWHILRRLDITTKRGALTVRSACAFRAY